MPHLLLVLVLSAYGSNLTMQKFDNREQCDIAKDAVMQLNKAHRFLFNPEVYCLPLATQE